MDYQKNTEHYVKIVMGHLDKRRYSVTSKQSYRLVYEKLITFVNDRYDRKYSEEAGANFIEKIKADYQGNNTRYLETRITAIRRLNDCLKDENLFPQAHYVYAIPSSSIFDKELLQYKSYLISKGISEAVIRYRVLEISNFLTLLEMKEAKKLSDIKVPYIYEAFENSNNKTEFFTGMRSFVQYAYKQEWVSVDYTFIVPKIPKIQKIPTVYTPQEIEDTLVTIDRTTAIGKRDYAILLIAARLGLRSSDIANLSMENLIGDQIKLVQVKTKNPLALPLLDDVYEAIIDYWNNARPKCDTDKIFVSIDAPYTPVTNGAINSRLQLYFDYAHIDISGKKHGVHTFRSSLASALLEEGNAYSTIQQVLGHKDPESMKHYAKVDIKQLRECSLSVLPPNGLFKEYLTMGRWSR